MIPSREDFQQLSDFLGGDAISGDKLKSTTGWNNNGNGTNSSGFNAYPGGRKHGGSFHNLNEMSTFWTNSNVVYHPFVVGMIYDSGSFLSSQLSLHSDDIAYNVRCLHEDILHYRLYHQNVETIVNLKKSHCHKSFQQQRGDKQHLNLSKK